MATVSGKLKFYSVLCSIVVLVEFVSLFAWAGGVPFPLGPESIGSPQAPAANPEYLTTAGTKVFFLATTALTGRELWVSDGTAEGTYLVRDIMPGPAEIYFEEVAPMGDKVFFCAEGPSTGHELWVSDGTEEGTHLVKDIYPGAGGSDVEHLTVQGSKLFFQATDPTHGQELWISDGTELGTKLVKDINVGLGDADIYSIIAAGGGVMFNAYAAKTGNELWFSDGTAKNTVMIKDINPEGDSQPEMGAFVDGVLYFSADDGTHGWELWKVVSRFPDGLDAVMVKDINEGANGSVPDDFAPLGTDSIVFVANDGVNGRELWKSDGTPAGTVLVEDIAIGADSPEIRNMTPTGGGASISRLMSRHPGGNYG